MNLASPLLLAVLLVGVSPASSLLAAEAEDPAVERGRQLFLHEFTPGDAISTNGDGLGPMFNANSCVACHSQGGVGGAGGLEHNVDLIAVATPRLKNDQRGRFAQHVNNSVHPGLKSFQPNLVLHAHSTQEGYHDLRQRALGIPVREGMTWQELARAKAAAERRMKRQGNLVSYEAAGVQMEWSQRQTPALFGLGVIDSIPREVLIRLAKEQENHPHVSGRLAGRFGWRGQTETLKEFVLGACANELGLQCGEEHSQAADPQRPDYRPPSDDLTVEQQNDLIAFVASLPAPPPEPGSLSRIFIPPAVKAKADQGKALFTSVGCATCHVENVGNATGIFSDLLLHDMGPALADSIPAPPQTASVEHRAPSFGYFGFSSFNMFAAIPSNTRQEWRTPPLWGVAASAPYLHDGRAETLEAAILMHGGEAEASVAAYRELDGVEQRNVLMFLNTLTPPDVSHLAPTPDEQESR